MISFLKRILLVAFISNSAIAGNVCNLIQYLVEFHGGLTFLDTDDASYTTTLNIHKISEAYFFYKGDYAFGKFKCNENTLYFIQDFPDKIKVKFEGHLVEKEGGVIAFSAVFGQLNDSSLPSEFNNLKTRGFSDVTCKGDSDTIRRQIAKDKTVTTYDKQHTFNVLINDHENQNICYGDAYYGLGRRDPRFVCTVKWERGNWGKTLSCI